jgi:copper transport protein
MAVSVTRTGLLDAVRHVLIVLAAAMAISGVAADQALSHATLVASVPADGQILAGPPTHITLRFNEPVSLLAATLVRPTGETAPLEQVTVSAEAVTIHLPSLVERGSYAVSWRVVSDDGHPIAATTFFAVGEASDTTSGRDDTVGTVAFGLWMVRLVLFGSLMFGVGGAAFRIVAGELPHGAVMSARLALGLGLVASPLLVGLQGLDLLGLGVANLLHVPAWIAGLGSPFSTTALLSAGSIGCAFLALEVRSHRLSVLLNSAALALLGLSVCFSGHASVAEPRWLAATALIAHVISISWWLGALLPLAFLLKLERRQATPCLISFSRYIPYAIFPLLISGTILAVLQLGVPGPHWWSAYGLIFACKLLLVIVLLGVASWNRWVLTAPAAAGKPQAVSQIRKGIIVEIILCIVILALVSAWRFTPPPRALVVEAPNPVELRLGSMAFEAMTTIEDRRTGTSDIAVQLLPAGPAARVNARSVKITMQPPGAALAPVIREADSAGDGRWLAKQVPLPVAGTWRIEVEVRITDFDLVKLKGVVDIKSR